jgi:hypothetical protein
MAGAITHLLVVDAALERAHSDPDLARLAELVQSATPFLLLGSVSPDLPYAMAIGPDKQWADRMHYLKTNGVGLQGSLELGLSNLVGRPEGNARLAWLAGYVAHCVTDATIHPIVQAIVGPYHTAPVRHRGCEMIQDALLFSETRKCDLQGTHFIHQLKLSASADREAFPWVVGFWFGLLKEVYEGLDPEPNPEQWRETYATILDVASDNALAGALSRKISGLSSLIYASPDQLRRERKDEARDCFDAVPNPHDRLAPRPFAEIGFGRAVENVLQVWRGLDHDVWQAKAIHDSAEKAAMPDLLFNWNLDTGANMDLPDPRVTYWPGAIGS